MTRYPEQSFASRAAAAEQIAQQYERGYQSRVRKTVLDYGTGSDLGDRLRIFPRKPAAAAAKLSLPARRPLGVAQREPQQASGRGSARSRSRQSASPRGRSHTTRSDYSAHDRRRMRNRASMSVQKDERRHRGRYGYDNPVPARRRLNGGSL